jgi:hypothetical protein
LKLAQSDLLENIARVAELVDALDLGSSSGDRMGVQVSPLAPITNLKLFVKLSYLATKLVRTQLIGKENHASYC